MTVVAGMGDLVRKPVGMDNLQAVLDASAPLWTVDATSGIGVPADAAEWIAVMAAAGVSKGAPTHLHLMQQSGLPLSDSIGTNHIATMGGGGVAPTYQQTRAGWARKFVNFTDNAGRYLYNAAASGSVRILSYVAVDGTAAGDRTILYCQGEWSIEATTGFNKVRFGAPATGTFVTGTISAVGGVKPGVLGTSVAGSASRFSDNAEKLVPAYATSNVNLFLGAAIANSAAFGIGYMAIWRGSDAEWSTAEEKSILQSLGWTIGWTP